MQREVNHLLNVIIFIGIIALFIFGIWNFAHAPAQPKASITINDTLYQSYDRDGSIVYANNNYICRVK
jgi:hypothetical protein